MRLWTLYACRRRPYQVLPRLRRKRGKTYSTKLDVFYVTRIHLQPLSLCSQEWGMCSITLFPILLFTVWEQTLRMGFPRDWRVLTNLGRPLCGESGRGCSFFMTEEHAT